MYGPEDRRGIGDTRSLAIGVMLQCSWDSRWEHPVLGLGRGEPAPWEAQFSSTIQTGVSGQVGHGVRLE